MKDFYCVLETVDGDYAIQVRRWGDNVTDGGKWRIIATKDTFEEAEAFMKARVVTLDGKSGWGPELKTKSYEISLPHQPVHEAADRMNLSYDRGYLVIRMYIGENSTYIMSDEADEQLKILADIAEFCRETTDFIKNKNTGLS